MTYYRSPIARRIHYYLRHGPEDYGVVLVHPLVRYMRAYYHDKDSPAHAIHPVLEYLCRGSDLYTGGPDAGMPAAMEFLYNADWEQKLFYLLLVAEVEEDLFLQRRRRNTEIKQSAQKALMFAYCRTSDLFSGSLDAEEESRLEAVNAANPL